MTIPVVKYVSPGEAVPEGYTVLTYHEDGGKDIVRTELLEGFGTTSADNTTERSNAL